MRHKNQVALDIYTFLFRTAFGSTKEEIEFRINQGCNGVVERVLDYIENKYLKGDD